MYLAYPTDNKVLETYYSKYSDTVLQKFKKLLTDGYLNVEKRNIKFKCILSDDIKAFITKYSEEKNLRKLLIGSWEELKSIILEILAIDSDFNVSISKTKHKLKTKQDVYEVNDINAIFYQLMVEDIYENSNVFDKTELVKFKNMSICPYCGAKSIGMYSGTGGKTIKPQIDHFLPKSKYPYFAISFNNLFPVCTECNGLSNKGENDPLASDFKTERLMHPTKFETTALTFIGNLLNPRDMKPDNVGLIVNYKDSHIKEGYNDVVAIEPYYHTQKVEIWNIYNHLWKANEEYKKYLETSGVNLDFLLTPFHILGFNESEDNSRITEKYKFRLDLYKSFLEKIITS